MDLKNLSTLNSVVPQPRAGAANSRGDQQPALTGEPNHDSEPARPARAVDTPSAAPPARGSIRGLRAQLVDIPPDLVDGVSQYLPAQDISAMARTNRDLRSATKERLSSLKAAHDVLQVDTLAKLQEPLERIRALPSNLRTEPLRQVMLQLHALPLQDRPQALNQFRAAVNEQPIQDRPTELPRLENILSHEDAQRAVTVGREDVMNVATAFRVTTEEGIRQLQALAHGGVMRLPDNLPASLLQLEVGPQAGLIRIPDGLPP